MHRLAILVCALAPSLVLLQYGIAKARARWDDAMIWETYFAGGMAALLVLLPEHWLKQAIANSLMSPVHGAAAEALFVAAAPEELAKFAMLFFAIKRYGNGTNRHDMITLSFAVALGFAAIENLGYLLLPGDWHFVALGRAGLSIPMHGLDGLAMGALLTAAGLSHHRGSWLSASLIVPILLHAFFDFPLMLVARNQGFAGVLPAWLLLQVPMTIGILWWCNRMRVAAGPAYNQPDGSSNPRLVGIAMLLLAPLLALTALLMGSNLGIAAAAMLILPSIFAIDLLWTAPKLVSSNSLSLGADGHQP
jgi:RsiW-degrading membrane proteinase PrsW (M82 family)